MKRGHLAGVEVGVGVGCLAPLALLGLLLGLLLRRR